MSFRDVPPFMDVHRGRLFCLFRFRGLPARHLFSRLACDGPGGGRRSCAGTRTRIFYPTRDGNILGIPTFEWSTMTATIATTNKIAIYGDFSTFLIADRLGGTVELIPHLFGATNRFPTGQRGAY
jgi:hypothetical protein